MHSDPAQAARLAALDRAGAALAAVVARADATHATVMRLAPRHGLPTAIIESARFDAAATRFVEHPALSHANSITGA